MKIERQNLTEEEVKIILGAFHAPNDMLANVRAGGEFIQANYGLTVKCENNQFYALIQRG